MIPKIIHYCWFGKNEKPKLSKKCIDSWKKYCPDFEIIEWNEDNFDINTNEYCKEMYKNKKWAFLTDYIRLKVVNQYGGIYLDTDVELLKPIDELLSHDAYIGLEANISLNTGLGFGSHPNNELLQKNIEYYESLKSFDDIKTCPIITTEIFKKEGYNPNSSIIDNFKGITIYPSEYFAPIDFISGKSNITDKTISIHHYAASWFNKEQRKRNRKRKRKVFWHNLTHTPNRIIKKLLSEERYNSLKSKIKK